MCSPTLFAGKPGVIASLLVLAVGTVTSPGGIVRGDGSASPLLTARQFRQPVALAFDGDRLFVANRRSGSLSVIDPATSRVVAETEAGRGLADVVTLGDGRHLLAVDQGENEVILLAHRDGEVRTVQRLNVSPDPVSVVVSPDGGSCIVASRWSRRLSSIAISRNADEPPALKTVRVIDLPFSPCTLTWLPGRASLVAADAFGGKLAVVDPGRGVVEAVRSLPAHNIRGLALAPDGRSLVVAHQVLHRLARSSFEDVHWGSLLSNHLRILAIDALLATGTDADLLRGSRLIDLGDVGNAAADPADVCFDHRANPIVALSGVGEIAIGLGPREPMRRTAVGRRPTALALSPDGTTVYVTDSSDDTVSVVDVGSGARLQTISLGPRPELSTTDRGERLFFDARLSHDGWMSCHSCHTDGHSNGLSSDTLGDGSFGAPKRVPSLLGVGATGPWTWAGSFDRLEDQVRKSIETTMRGPSPSDEQVEALSAYLRSLVPPSPDVAPAESRDEAAVARGRALFRSHECATCHAPPEYTTPDTYDIGLADEVGNRKFNPPSLRGVGLREPLFHDGRAKTLTEVFLPHQHPRGKSLTTQEVADLVAFLKTL